MIRYADKLFEETNPQPKIKKLHYLCLCKVSYKILFWARIVGILPIKSVRCGIKNCSYAISKRWFIYSVVLQIVYFTYFCLNYGARILCFPEHEPHDQATDWFLKIIGYFITDLDALVALGIGSTKKKTICKLLQNLSKIGGSTVEMKKLQSQFNFMIRVILLYFISKCLLFAYIAVKAANKEHGQSIILCGTVDSVLVVMIRGFVNIFPAIQLAVVGMFVMIIGQKFDYLSSVTNNTINNVLNEQKRYDVALINNQMVATEEENYMTNKKYYKFCQLAEMHTKIFDILHEVNSCFGVQLLVTNCSCLFSTIYYLYRYITASTEGHRSKNFPRWHYLLSFFFRLAKILTYMMLGKKLNIKSVQPLEVLQQASVVNFSLYTQQQIQTLTLQWSSKKAFLSAYGIINLGPWLLAPIAGNVITYLLVALQFDNVPLHDTNATIVLQSLP